MYCICICSRRVGISSTSVAENYFLCFSCMNIEVAMTSCVYLNHTFAHYMYTVYIHHSLHSLTHSVSLSFVPTQLVS